MAVIDNDLMRVYSNDAGRLCRQARALILEIRRLDLRYTEDIKPLVDANADTDTLDRKRQAAGVPDPSMTDIKQARAALNFLADVDAGVAVAAQTNFDKKLSKLDPFPKLP